MKKTNSIENEFEVKQSVFLYNSDQQELQNYYKDSELFSRHETNKLRKYLRSWMKKLLLY